MVEDRTASFKKVKCPGTKTKTTTRCPVRKKVNIT